MKNYLGIILLIPCLFISFSVYAVELESWPFEGEWTNDHTKKSEIDCFPGVISFKSVFKPNAPKQIGGFSGDMVSGKALEVGAITKGPCSPGKVILATTYAGSKGVEFMGPRSLDDAIDFDERKQSHDCEERSSADVYIETNKNFVVLKDPVSDFKNKSKKVLKLNSKNAAGLIFPEKMKSSDGKLDFLLNCSFQNEGTFQFISGSIISTPYGDLRILESKTARNSLYLQNSLGLTAIYSSPQFGLEIPGYVFAGYAKVEPKRLVESRLSKLKVKIYEFKSGDDPDLDLSYTKYLEAKRRDRDSTNNSKKETTPNPPKSKPLTLSKVDFVKLKPFVFHYDPLNRLEKYVTNHDSRPVLAEPVIYLYPKSSTWVDVNIGEHVHVIESAPKYNNGWRVFVTPNGPITDLEGNKMGVLFWEGAVQELPPWTEAWHVHSQNLTKFFHEILPKLGLSRKESEDFIRYWDPILKTEGYYDIRFLTKNDIETMAPLRTKPKFDTVIRIEMEARKSTAIPTLPEPVPPITPERKGSVLVEWGGVTFMPQFNF